MPAFQRVFFFSNFLNHAFSYKVKKQHEKAAKILADNKEKLDELADYLYERETITGEEFMNILNAA